MSATGKKAAELQDLIMEDIRDRPECKDITGVVVASDESFNWKVIAINRSTGKQAPNAAVDAATARLRQQYHLIGG
jgi:hypothetical protein